MIYFRDLKQLKSQKKIPLTVDVIIMRADPQGTAYGFFIPLTASRLLDQ